MKELGNKKGMTLLHSTETKQTKENSLSFKMSIMMPKQFNGERMTKCAGTAGDPNGKKLTLTFTSHHTEKLT